MQCTCFMFYCCFKAAKREKRQKCVFQEMFFFLVLDVKFQIIVFIVLFSIITKTAHELITVPNTSQNCILIQKSKVIVHGKDKIWKCFFFLVYFFVKYCGHYKKKIEITFLDLRKFIFDIYVFLFLWITVNFYLVSGEFILFFNFWQVTISHYTN